jgi:hypothetical protein
MSGALRLKRLQLLLRLWSKRRPVGRKANRGEGRNIRVERALTFH